VEMWQVGTVGKWPARAVERGCGPSSGGGRDEEPNRTFGIAAGCSENGRQVSGKRKTGTLTEHRGVSRMFVTVRRRVLIGCFLEKSRV